MVSDISEYGWDNDTVIFSQAKEQKQEIQIKPSERQSQLETELRNENICTYIHTYIYLYVFIYNVAIK